MFIFSDPNLYQKKTSSPSWSPKFSVIFALYTNEEPTTYITLCSLCTLCLYSQIRCCAKRKLRPCLPPDLFTYYPFYLCYLMKNPLHTNPFVQYVSYEYILRSTPTQRISNLKLFFLMLYPFGTLVSCVKLIHKPNTNRKLVSNSLLRWGKLRILSHTGACASCNMDGEDSLHCISNMNEEGRWVMEPTCVHPVSGDTCQLGTGGKCHEVRLRASWIREVVSKLGALTSWGNHLGYMWGSVSWGSVWVMVLKGRGANNHLRCHLNRTLYGKGVILPTIKSWGPLD